MTSTSPPLPPEARSSTLALSRPVLWIVGAILAWFLVSEIGTEAWFRWKEARIPKSPEWSLQWPDENSASERGFLDFKERELTSREEELLHYTQSDSGAWRDREGNFWTGFFLQWEQDKRLNQSDFAHNPTRCLPAAGLTLVRALPMVDVDVSGLPMKFKCWEFMSDGRTIYVYLSVRRPLGFSDTEYALRGIERRKGFLQKTLEGNRSNPVQLIELIVVGPRSVEAAEDALKKQLVALFEHD